MKRTPMTTKSKSGKPRSPKPAQPNDIEESIRRRAYLLLIVFAIMPLLVVRR